MQAGGHLPSGVSAARSTAKGRGVEGFADGDEGVGDEDASEVAPSSLSSWILRRSMLKGPVCKVVYAAKQSRKSGNRRAYRDPMCRGFAVCARAYFPWDSVEQPLSQTNLRWLLLSLPA